MSDICLQLTNGLVKKFRAGSASIISPSTEASYFRSHQDITALETLASTYSTEPYGITPVATPPFHGWISPCA
jgi:hypothetical protein